jgi:hypothetical protein
MVAVIRLRQTELALVALLGSVAEQKTIVAYRTAHAPAEVPFLSFAPGTGHDH